MFTLFLIWSISVDYRPHYDLFEHVQHIFCSLKNTRSPCTKGKYLTKGYLFYFWFIKEQTCHFSIAWCIQFLWLVHNSDQRTQALFSLFVVLWKREGPCAPSHRSKHREERGRIYDWVTPAEGVIYSLICCCNGQRIITCKILINV